MEDEEEESSQKKSRVTNPQAAALAAAAVDSFTDDLIVEILSRLPARSVHRFKCVSRSWRDLITHPAHRKKMPQALAGFFYTTFLDDRRNPVARHFADVSGAAHPPVDPSLPFLPPNFRDVDQLDTCAGLVLCRYMALPSGNEPDVYIYVYVVCNPATGRWVELPLDTNPKPKSKYPVRVVRLAFDPAVSSHFHVFVFEDIYIAGVSIYSSQTGAWNYRESKDKYTGLNIERRSVFLNGMLHLITRDDSMLVVDTEGMAWMTIPVPLGCDCGYIGLSKGRLLFMNTIEASETEISVWCFEDYDSKEWVLKHCVSTEEVFRRTGQTYNFAEFHPNCDIIFLDSWDNTALTSYDMERAEFRHILNLEEGYRGLYLPYVPLFSESLADADGS